MSLIVGIDPGKTTGVALYNETTDTLLELHSMDFWSAFNYAVMSPALTICVEVPSTRAVFHAPSANIKATQRTATHVGGVIREAELMADGLEKSGKKVIRINPQGKMPHEKFCRLTGWTGRSNEHTRDAALQIMRRRTGR